MNDDRSPRQQVADLVAYCRSEHLKIATAESCTGGLVAGAITEVAGASEVFDWGVVTYSNEAKTALLGVPASLIGKHGAVSVEVATAMAEGALHRSGADCVVAVTGIAGPDGGSEEKPVGLVYLAAARTGQSTFCERHKLGNRGRSETRLAATRLAIRILFRAVRM
ncbi:MAG: CinA family protein [Alphaproteobacteria bacterium]